MPPLTAHVLVIEDDPNNLIVIQDLLSLAGIRHVYTASNGDQGLQVAQTLKQLDLILLDIQLPGADGYTILKKLRAQDQFDRCQIVALTANVMAADQAQAREAGFNGFIGKPVNFARFPEQIQTILQGEEVWSPR